MLYTTLALSIAAAVVVDIVKPVRDFDIDLSFLSKNSRVKSEVEAVVFGFVSSPTVKLKDSRTDISSISLSNSNSNVIV